MKGQTAMGGENRVFVYFAKTTRQVHHDGTLISTKFNGAKADRHRNMRYLEFIEQRSA
jgi:hypothetical protein